MTKHLHNALGSNYYATGIALYASQYGLKPADRLIEPIFQTGLSKHHSIYLGIDAQGTEWIAENHKFIGVRLVKASDYFKKKKDFTIEPFIGNQMQRSIAVQRALSTLGQPYDLISYNCEHYASYVQYGKAESKQVVNTVALLITLFFIGFAVAE